MVVAIPVKAQAANRVPRASANDAPIEARDPRPSDDREAIRTALSDCQRLTRLFAAFKVRNADIVRERESVEKPSADGPSLALGLADSVLDVAERVTTSLGSVGRLSSRMIMREAPVSTWEKALLAEDLIILGYAVDELTRVAGELRRALADRETLKKAPSTALPPEVKTAVGAIAEGSPMV